MADYINGKEFYEELKIYHAKYLESVTQGEDKPLLSDKIAFAIIQISTRLMNSYNFVNYTYRDEMISDAILKCLDKVHRFDPAISENAFAFFTQISWHAAITRIKVEQKESSVKARLIREKMSSEFVTHGVDSDNDDGGNSFVEFLKENDAFVDYIDLKKQASTNQHDSMKHRNKTPYVKKAKEVVDDYYFDLSEFEAE
jgi:hypothetical protein